MSSGGALPRSRDIPTLRNIHHFRTSPQFAASEGPNLLQSFARGGCGLPGAGVRRRAYPGWGVLRFSNGVRHESSRFLGFARNDRLSVTLSGASKTRSRGDSFRPEPRQKEKSRDSIPAPLFQCDIATPAWSRSRRKRELRRSVHSRDRKPTADRRSPS